MTGSRSIHDNRILSYTVECAARRITLRTVFDDHGTDELTDVEFVDVAAYHFGTIIFDIGEESNEDVYSSYELLFEKLAPYGWPAPALATGERWLRHRRETNMRAYVLSASFGMMGFVVATDMHVRAA